MTTTPNPSDPVALVSIDGTTWSHAPAGRVTKIVIGTPPKPGDDAKLVGLKGEVLDKLTELLASPDLTHLHLWQIDNRAAILTQLPGKLQALDVRGCPDLTTLPPLPGTLETLDVGWCANLSEIPYMALPALSWFHVDGCVQLDETDLNAILKKCQALLEFTATDCVQLSKLSLPPQSTSLQLRRLDLNGCAGLTSLTAFPKDQNGEPSVSSLYIAGCRKLETFCGMDVREVMRS